MTRLDSALDALAAVAAVADVVDATLDPGALPEPVAELVRFLLTTLANGDSVAVIRTTP